MPITNKNTAVVLDTLNKTTLEPTALLFNVISEDNAKLVAGGSAVSIGKISKSANLEPNTKYDDATTCKESIYRYFENTALPFYMKKAAELSPINPGDGTAATPLNNKDKGRHKHFSPRNNASRHYTSTEHGLAVTVMPPFTLTAFPSTPRNPPGHNEVSGIISGFMSFKNNPNAMSVFCFSAPETNPIVAASFTSEEINSSETFVDYLGQKNINVSLHATGNQ